MPRILDVGKILSLFHVLNAPRHYSHGGAVFIAFKVRPGGG